jgi:hypothetical protein
MTSPTACPQATPLVTPLVETVVAEGVAGFTTYRLSVLLGDVPFNVHLIYGITDSPIVLPPAYQSQNGVNVGGVSPELFDALPTTQYDSWLTVGTTDGSVVLSTVGIDFDSWTQDSGVSCENGLVTYLDEHALVLPSDAPSGTVVVAQVTAATGSCGTDSQVTLNFQGHAQDRTDFVEYSDVVPDWAAEGVVFTLC